jgi:hypothetical protein
LFRPEKSGTSTAWKKFSTLWTTFSMLWKTWRKSFHGVEVPDFQPQMSLMNADGTAGGHLLVRRQEI